MIPIYRLNISEKSPSTLKPAQNFFLYVSYKEAFHESGL